MRSIFSIPPTNASEALDLKKTLFRPQSMQTLVKEVVMFRPAPANTEALRIAQERQAAGKSIFIQSATKITGGKK